MKKIKKKKLFLGAMATIISTVANIANSAEQNKLQKEQIKKEEQLHNESVARENALRQTQNIQNNIDFVNNLKKEYITPLRFGGTKRVKQKNLNRFK